MSENSFRKIEINEIGDTDRRTFIKLKRGQFNVEAKLDLHGLTLVEAYSALWDFLIRSHKNDLKCVLIITGKGIKIGTNEQITATVNSSATTFPNNRKFNESGLEKSSTIFNGKKKTAGLM